MKPFLLWLQGIGLYLSPVADITLPACPLVMQICIVAYAAELAVVLVNTWNKA